MIKEIKVKGVISGRNFEESFLTNDENYITKKQDGYDMIGFLQIGKKRNTWLPLGANLTEIKEYHADTGRFIKTIYQR